MRFFVSCAKGTEGPLRRELVGLRIRGPRGATGGVSFEGRLEDGLAVCLWSRVAMRVLLEVGHFPAASADQLYAGTRAIDWSQHLDTRRTLAVSASVRDNPALGHSGFAALKVKDAVVDALRDKLGARPDVNVEDPDVPLTLFLEGDQARLFLDLSGEPLHRRGYRKVMTDAPLKESLAAAILQLGGVDPHLPFLDPMAGSGTLAIEQAMAARAMAPGLHRRFAFERWPSQGHAADWERLKAEARERILPCAPAPIVARDIAAAAIAAARRNAEAAGVAADITFEQGGLTGLVAPPATGTLVTNPPYGTRLDDKDLPRLYDDLSRALGRFSHWRLVLFSGNPLLSRVFIRRPDISHRLWNGPLETRLLVYAPRGLPSPSP
jgi:23S rRNA G2445 N2-methylase RlmL